MKDRIFREKCLSRYFFCIRNHHHWDASFITDIFVVIFSCYKKMRKRHHCPCHLSDSSCTRPPKWPTSPIPDLKEAFCLGRLWVILTLWFLLLFLVQLFLNYEWLWPICIVLDAIYLIIFYWLSPGNHYTANYLLFLFIFIADFCAFLLDHGTCGARDE